MSDLKALRNASLNAAQKAYEAGAIDKRTFERMKGPYVSRTNVEDARTVFYALQDLLYADGRGPTDSNREKALDGKWGPAKALYDAVDAEWSAQGTKPSEDRRDAISKFVHMLLGGDKSLKELRALAK